MFKIKPAITFILNILLIFVCWILYRNASGAEHPALLLVPLSFILASFSLTTRLTGVLAFGNMLFFMYLSLTGIIDMVDVSVLLTLTVVIAGAGYIIKNIYESFIFFQENEVRTGQNEYNGIVNHLEDIDHKGMKAENELSRMSRLYEINKKLAPVLRLDDLIEVLFSFLEDNFRFHIAHLLVFEGGKFSRGVSKSIDSEGYFEDNEMVLDYEKLAEYAGKKDFDPIFVDDGGEGAKELSKALKRTGSGTFMAFTMYAGDSPCAILAIEDASRSSYDRFRVLIPQIALGIRRVELYEQVQKLSIIDGLTEVYLRRYLMERLEEEVDRSRRLGLTFSVGMVDVDRFKQCNDKYGHLVGDTVLRKIAEKFKNSVREVDMVGRYGGEEFCIVLPETTKELALTVAERLRVSVEAKDIRAFDEEIKVTVSVGVATYPEDGKNITEIIEKADTALYMAKRKGRNIVCAAP